MQSAVVLALPTAGRARPAAAAAAAIIGRRRRRCATDRRPPDTMIITVTPEIIGAQNSAAESSAAEIAISRIEATLAFMRIEGVMRTAGGRAAATELDRGARATRDRTVVNVARQVVRENAKRLERSMETSPVKSPSLDGLRSKTRMKRLTSRSGQTSQKGSILIQAFSP